MRFVLAIVSFVIAAAMIAVGVAQRTVLQAPSRVVAEATVDSEAPVTVIQGTTLNAHDRSQTIEISGSDTIFAAYGRTTDVLAWVGDTQHNLIGYDAEEVALTSELVEGEAAEVPDPAGSDLWYESFTAEEELRLTLDVPEDVSVLIVSDGTAPAPGELSIRWPLDNRAPLSGPLIIGGAILLLVGLGLLLWALSHMRSTRGPQRKTPKPPKPPKMPKVPRQRALPAVRRPAAIAAPERGRRSARRGFIALPVIAVIALAGCTATPAPAASPTPEATAAAPEEDVLPPAVTVSQFERIMADVAEVVATADENRDEELAATRLGGAALELREANYTIRDADNEIGKLPAILAGDVQVTLPQASDTWPRTVMGILQNEQDETVPAMAVVLVQEDPRANYKVHYAVTLEPNAQIPDLAPPGVGAPRLDPELDLFAFRLDELSAAYGDILMNGDQSEHAAAFDLANDSLLANVGPAAKQQKKDELPTTASLEFAVAPGDEEPIVLATNDSGVLVSVTLDESETVKPVEEGAAINPSGSIKALTGKDVSTKGFTATYADQLLFYVPPASDGGKIVLLGYSQGLISASELP